MQPGIEELKYDLSYGERKKIFCFQLVKKIGLCCEYSIF